MILREILDTTEARLATELKGHPKVEAELRMTLGMVYRDLGDNDRSESLLREAVNLRRRTQAGSLALADTLMELAFTLQAHLERAETETWHRLLSVPNRTRLNEAEALAQEALIIRRNLRGGSHPDVAVSLEALSHLFYQRGAVQAARAFASEGLAMARKTLPEEDPDVVSLKQQLAIVLGETGEFRAAEALDVALGKTTRCWVCCLRTCRSQLNGRAAGCRRLKCCSKTRWHASENWRVRSRMTWHAFSIN
jgi:hypothetical protein